MNIMNYYYPKIRPVSYDPSKDFTSVLRVPTLHSTVKNIHSQSGKIQSHKKSACFNISAVCTVQRNIT